MNKQRDDIVAMIEAVDDDFLIITDDADNLFYIWRNKERPFMRAPWYYDNYRFNAVFINLTTGAFKGGHRGVSIKALDMGIDKVLRAFSGDEFNPAKARLAIISGQKAKAMKKEANDLLSALRPDWLAAAS